MARPRSTSPPKSAWPGVSMMLIVRSCHFTAVFLARMVMPFSRSRSPESMTRSVSSSWAVNEPVWRSILSTSVVLPWSTWAMMAMFLREVRNVMAITHYYVRPISPNSRGAMAFAGVVARRPCAPDRVRRLRRSAIVPSTQRQTPASGHRPMSRAGARPSWSAKASIVRSARSPGPALLPGEPARTRTMTAAFHRDDDDVTTGAKGRSSRRNVVVGVARRDRPRSRRIPSVISWSWVAQFAASAVTRPMTGCGADASQYESEPSREYPEAARSI